MEWNLRQDSMRLDYFVIHVSQRGVWFSGVSEPIIQPSDLTDFAKALNDAWLEYEKLKPMGPRINLIKH